MELLLALRDPAKSLEKSCHEKDRKELLGAQGAKLSYEPSSGRLAIGLPGPRGLVELSVERGNPGHYELLELLASKDALELGFSSLPLRLPLERVEQLLVDGLDPERYLSVGACAGGGAVALDLSEHLLVAGGTGTGKTELLKTIALHGATQKSVEVQLFSPWADAWAEDSSWKKVLEVPGASGLRFVGSDELEAFYAIRSLARSLESRREALAAKQAGAIGATEFPTVYLLLDEAMGIFEPGDAGKSYLMEAIAKDLRLLLESGGSLGIYVALSSQRPELIPSALRELFSARVLMGDPRRISSSELIFGTQSVHGGGFDGAWGRGAVLAGAEQRLFQGYFTEDLGSRRHRPSGR